LRLKCNCELDWTFADVLCDWSTIIALLMREGEALTDHALRTSQIAILLQLFASSAKHVAQQRQALAAQDRSSSKSVKSEARLIRDRYDSLNSILQTHLPLLLSRFQDDEGNMVVLSELFSCCDMVTNAKIAKTMLGKMVDLFVSFPKSPLLANICQSLRHFLDSDGPLRTASRTAVANMVGKVRLQIASCAESLRALVSRGDQKRSKKRSPDDLREMDDALMELSSMMEKMKVLWQSYDCREFIGSVSDAF
jgi:hypothetical protein